MINKLNLCEQLSIAIFITNLIMSIHPLYNVFAFGGWTCTIIYFYMAMKFKYNGE